MTPSPLTRALDQVAACRAALASLDAREAAHHAQLTAQVQALTRRPAQDSSPAGPTPGPGAGLQDWVEGVYRPGYGHLAVLGPCWPQHPLCRYGLDILRQLHTALYLEPDPDAGTDLLTAQAEYQARILPAIAAQLAAETTRCGHPTLTTYPGAQL